MFLVVSTKHSSKIIRFSTSPFSQIIFRIDEFEIFRACPGGRANERFAKFVNYGAIL